MMFVNPYVMFYYKLLDEPTQKDLIQLIEQLPEKYREAVYMAEVEDASPYAIAQKLNLNCHTAKTRVQRGRAQLRELMQIPDPSHMFSLGIHAFSNCSKGKNS